MTINRERLKLGVQELLTTTLPQGKGAPRNGEKRCCLGILTEVAIANGLELKVRESDGSWYYGEHGHSVVLCAEVRDWYGFKASSPALELPEPSALFGEEVTAVKAHEANDNLGLPFHTIGLMFAKTYLGLEPQG